MKSAKIMLSLLSALYLFAANVYAAGPNPATSDSTNLYTYIIIAIIAVVLIAAVIFTNQKKKK